MQEVLTERGFYAVMSHTMQSFMKIVYVLRGCVERLGWYDQQKWHILKLDVWPEKAQRAFGTHLIGSSRNVEDIVVFFEDGGCRSVMPRMAKMMFLIQV